jgi:hypothetical protein
VCTLPLKRPIFRFHFPLHLPGGSNFNSARTERKGNNKISSAAEPLLPHSAFAHSNKCCIKLAVTPSNETTETQKMKFRKRDTDYIQLAFAHTGCIHHCSTCASYEVLRSALGARAAFASPSHAQITIFLRPRMIITVMGATQNGWNYIANGWRLDSHIYDGFVSLMWL